ncbi:MAG TPA: type II toxin-antitoxin system RelE/ParE family toxin [Armatimonadota bacterium]|nr:type II toxin-antitoxin system RelE/ParE family toxin [Armatimonadota bacterium]
MAREVRWTEAAWSDLADIVAYIAADSPANAAAFAQQLLAAAASLQELSQRGRIVPETGRPDIRELLIKHYRLIYHLTTTTIDILALVHGMRKLQYLPFIEPPAD